MEDLAAAVREIQDRQAILDCITRFCRGVDRMDRDLILSAYHPDAVDDHGVFVGGPEALTDWMLVVCQKIEGSAHMIGNHTVEIVGDTAHAETYVLTGSMPYKLSCGRYIDRLERRDGKWGIVARKVVLDWWAPMAGPSASGIGPEQINAAGPPTRDRTDPSYARPLRVAAERLAAAE